MFPRGQPPGTPGTPGGQRGSGVWGGAGGAVTPAAATASPASLLGSEKQRNISPSRTWTAATTAAAAPDAAAAAAAADSEARQVQAEVARVKSSRHATPIKLSVGGGVGGGAGSSTPGGGAGASSSAIQDELARIKRFVANSPARVGAAAAAAAATTASPRGVSPLRGAAAAAAAPAPVATAAVQPFSPPAFDDPVAVAAAAAADAGADTVGQLQHALSTRQSRANRMLAEREAVVAQQGRDLAVLRAEAEAARERHAAQVGVLEGKVDALQTQLQRALRVDSARHRTRSGSPRGAVVGGGDGVEALAEARHAHARTDKAEREIERLSDALHEATTELHKVQDDLNEERLERAKAAGSARLAVRKELEQAHAATLAEQRREWEEQRALECGTRDGRVAQLTAELEALRREYVSLESEREKSSRTERGSGQELERLRRTAAAGARDADDALQFRLQAERATAAAADLKAANRRLLNREGALEARVVELELAAGLAQEEAASEERLRAAGELTAVQERHRQQAKRDAEELGRLRGMLSAAEAKLELSEEVGAGLEAKVETLQRQLLESASAQTSAVTKIDARELELDQQEAKIDALQRNLADNRGLLGRQAGQLQANQERATFLEGRLQEAEEAVNRLECENAALVAENSEARATAEAQAGELQLGRAQQEAAEAAVAEQRQRLGEAQTELAACGEHLAASRHQVRQAEEKAHGLEAALASQASTLRHQLQVDADSEAALRVTRERTEWEASTMELEQHLQVACRRRRVQARLSAEAMEACGRAAALSKGFVGLLKHARRCQLARAVHLQKRHADEADSLKRRELSLIEELDVVRVEHGRALAVASATPKTYAAAHGVTCAQQWSLHVFRGRVFSKWLLWTRMSAQRSTLRRVCLKAARQLNENKCDRGLLTTSYVAWVRYVARVASRRLATLRGTTSDALHGHADLRVRSRALARWSSWALTVQSGRVAEEKRHVTRQRMLLFGETAAVLFHARLRSTLEGAYAAWLRFYRVRLTARSTEEARVEREAAEAAHAREMAAAQARLSEAEQAAAQLTRRRAATQPYLSELLLRKNARCAAARHFGAWMRWLCLKGLLAGSEEQASLRRRAAMAEAEAGGRRAQLEAALDDVNAERDELRAAHEELQVEHRELAERCGTLEVGFAQARRTFTEDLEELTNRGIDLEAERDELHTELRYTAEELSCVREQAASGLNATLNATQGDSKLMTEEMTMVKASLASAETTIAKTEESLRLREREVDQLQDKLSATEDRCIMALDELRVLKATHEEELRDPRSKLAAADLELSEGRGKMVELEAQVLGRTSEQFRLSKELEVTTASLSQETERRKTLERALNEVKETCDKQAEELVTQVVSLDSRLHAALQENESFKTSNDALEIEVAQLRGRMLQVDRMRAKSGPASEFRSATAQDVAAEEILALKEANARQEEELNVSARKVLDAERKVGVFKSKVAAQENTVAELRALAEELEASSSREQDRLAAEAEDAADENAQLKNLLRALRVEAETWQEEAAELRAKRDAELEELDDLRSSLAALQAERDDDAAAAAAAAAAQQQQQQAEQQREELDEEVASTLPSISPNTAELPSEPRTERRAEELLGDDAAEPPAAASPPPPPQEGVAGGRGSAGEGELQSVPPASPPSPFGRRARREGGGGGDAAAAAAAAAASTSSLSGEELEKLHWIFAYGDADGDGFLNYRELLRLSADTSGGLDREQYDSIVECLNAPARGLSLQHLERLYLELGSPGDIDDNYEMLRALHLASASAAVTAAAAASASPSAASPASPVPPPPMAEAGGGGGGGVVAASPVESPAGSRASVGYASPVVVPAAAVPAAVAASAEAENKSPATSVMSGPSRKKDRGVLPYGKSGSLPFRVTLPTKQDPEPIVQVTTTNVKAVPKGCLVIEVTNHTTGDVTKIAGREQFLHATTEAGAAFEGTVLTLKIVKDSQAIKQWKEQRSVPKKKGQKRVYPTMPKTMIETVKVTLEPLSSEGKDLRVQKIVVKAEAHSLSSKSAFNQENMFALTHNPDAFKTKVQSKLEASGTEPTGNDGILQIVSAIQSLCGFPVNPATLIFTAHPSGDGFVSLWKSSRAAYLRAFETPPTAE